jgi:hypothetical protein
MGPREEERIGLLDAVFDDGRPVRGCPTVSLGWRGCPIHRLTDPIYSGKIVGIFDGDYARMGATITLIYLLGMILIWFAPETKGRSLPK